LGDPFHGKGIMSEAVALLTAYAFAELNIFRIYAGIMKHPGKYYSKMDITRRQQK